MVAITVTQSLFFITILPGYWPLWVCALYIHITVATLWMCALQIHIIVATSSYQPDFLDYIQGGWVQLASLRTADNTLRYFTNRHRHRGSRLIIYRFSWWPALLVNWCSWCPVLLVNWSSWCPVLLHVVNWCSWYPCLDSQLMFMIDVQSC